MVGPMDREQGTDDPRFQWLGLDVLAENIPGDLIWRENWVVWKAKQNGDRVEKIPLKVYGGGGAKSNDRTTWADFDGAIAAYLEGDCAGIGFVLEEGGGLVGLDFDHVRDAQTGRIDDDVMQALGEIGTYAEVSPSGTGVRLIAYGTLPEGLIQKGKRLEVYDRGRFLTITGHVLASYRQVAQLNTDKLSGIMRRFIPQRSQNNTSSQPGDFGDTLDVAGYVAGILDATNLHDGLVRLAAHYAATGMAEKSIRETLHGILTASSAKEHEPGRWQERMKEIPRIASSAVEKFSPKAKEKEEQTEEDREKAADLWANPLEVTRIIEEPPPPITWLVEERIQAGRAVILSGIGGSSKSRVLYHLAAGVATGCLPWDWQIAATGKTLLVMTEDTAEDVHRALHHTCASLDTGQKRLIAENLIIYALAGNQIKLLGMYEGVLSPTPLAEQLETRILAEGDVRLVAIDPALGITEGDEMDQSDQHTLGKYCDGLAVRTKAAVILVTHSPKASISQDELQSHGSRGAGAITDAVRGEFQLRTMTAGEAMKAGILDIEERKRHVQLVATKGNHLPAAAYVPVWLRRGDGGALAQADMALETENDADDLRGRLALQILTELSVHETVTLAKWTAECEAKGILRAKKPEAVKSEMRRIKDRLLQAGLITPGMGRGTWMPAQLY